MRLRSLVVIFGAVSLVLLCLAASVVYKQMDALARVKTPSALVDRLGFAAFELAAVAVRFANEPDRPRRNALNRASHALALATKTVGAGALFADAEMARELDALNDRTRVLAERLCAANDPDQPCLTREEAAWMLDASDELLGLSERLGAIAEPTIALREAQGQRALRRAGAALLALFVGMGVLSMAFWSFMAHRVLRPLASLRDGFERVGAGALDHRIVMATRDECGEIGRAFNRMVADLQRVTASRAELESEIARRAALEADLRERNAQLIQMNVELDAFARIAAHDLRAPLRGVKALAEWMAEDFGDDCPPDTRFHLTLMIGRISRLDALVDSLQRYAEIGRVAHAIELFQPAKFIRWLAREIDPANSYAIRFEGPDATILVHRAPVEVALTELLGNAIKHHDRPEGAVTVGMRIEGGRVDFTVTDDGPGVPADLQARIFEMFQTLRPRDDVEGAGMGLTLIQKAARIYGGKLRVESPVGDGRGCAFVLSWPVRETTARDRLSPP